MSKLERIAWRVLLSATALCLVAMLTGCAYLRSSTKRTEDPETKIVTVKTYVRSWSLFANQAGLTKFRNAGELTRSNEWSSGTSMSGATSGTVATNAPNLNDLAAAVTAAAVRAAVKP